MSTVFLLMILLPGSTTWAPIAELPTFKRCLSEGKNVLMWYNKRTTWEQPRVKCELLRDPH